MGLLLDEFVDRDLSCIPKVIQVLKYLNQGRELELDGYIYKIAETNNKGFNLVFKMQCFSSGETIENSHDEWFGYQGDLTHFSGMCEKLTEEQLTVMAANMALTEIHREQSKQR